MIEKKLSDKFTYIQQNKCSSFETSKANQFKTDPTQDRTHCFVIIFDATTLDVV
jgi:hypothetical protein